jgi:hypothetical protein
MPTGAYKMQRMASFGSDFFRANHKDGIEFLNHVVWVTDNETWVSYENVEIKEQSKQWVYTQSQNKLNMF